MTFIRNKMYDRGILPSYHSPLKTIIIGNLQVGGSGKTPLTAFLYGKFSAVFRTAILSRGYGRKTRGLREAGDYETPATIGDEPLWYKQTLPGVTVVVSEKRKKGLKYLENKQAELVLLDDAYQHRAVEGDVYLMLTDYAKPYYKDYPLPAGRLREYRTSDKRADIIVVTKCPDGLTVQEKVEMIQEINPYDHQWVFFCSVRPGKPYALKGQADYAGLRYTKIVAMSGIANPDSFIMLCRQFNRPVTPLNFRDHHDYTTDDLKKLESLIDQNTVVLTTEKDAVKLKEKNLYSVLPSNQVFVLPIDMHVLFHEEEKFLNAIREGLNA